jgi:hypothetical protein
MRSSRLIIFAGLTVFAATAKSADDDVLDDLPLLDAQRPPWILTVGAELDGDGGYLVDAGAAFSPGERTTFALHAGHSDTSTLADKLTATTIGLDFDQGFDHWGYALSAAYWKDPDLVEAADYGGSLFFKWGAWRLSASVEARASDFNSFAVNGTIPRPNQPPLAVSGQASCDLDDLGIGARFAYTGKLWSAYVSGKSYDYDDFDCRFSSLSVGGLRIRPERLRALNPAFLQLLTLRATAAGFFNLRENTVFLDSSLAAGMSMARGTRTYALDFSRSKELLDGLMSNTFTGSLTFALSRRTDLELHVGVFDAEEADTIGFAGVTLIAYVGG